MKPTKRNYLFLIAGIIILLSAITHAINGQATVLPEIDHLSLDGSTKTIFRYVWHIITAENLIFGMALIFMAFYSKREKVWFVAWLIAIVLLTRLFVIFLFTLIYDSGSLWTILTDSIAIIILVVLLLLGARKRGDGGET